MAQIPYRSVQREFAQVLQRITFLRGESFGLSTSGQKAIDLTYRQSGRLVYELYELTKEEIAIVEAEVRKPAVRS
jgi:hypothetical protein